jgi:cellulose synthase/poly-beta-1,6-N-acetylglucosamine synthase-like glycosyltransferase
MIDAGTIPLKRSIARIIEYMDMYPRVGGACGEIEVFEPSDKELGYGIHRITDQKLLRKIIEDPDDVDIKEKINDRQYICIGKDQWYEVKQRNCMQRFEAKCMILAQYVEYKISHYLDKSFESLFGFVSVLPGAFCTFRWAAINGDPLKSFFKGLEKDKHTAKEANMYLAEDRVMCLEILRKYSENWLLRYIPGCKALTDPPDSVIGLIKQRRRWTNGSLFASWYVIDHLNMINRSGHSCMRKTCLSMLYVYMLINFIFSLLLVGSLYASFSIFIKAFFEKEECNTIGGARAFDIAYLSLLFVFVLMSITKPITKSGWIYSVFVVIFGIFIFISIGFGFVYFWKNTTNIYVAFLLAAALVGSYVIPPLLNFRRMSV